MVKLFSVTQFGVVPDSAYTYSVVFAVITVLAATTLPPAGPPLAS